MISQFHFIRPLWLIALLPALIIIIYWLRNYNRTNSNIWAKYCDKHLLNELIINQQATRNKSLPLLIAAIWLLIILALAGPTWSKYNSATFQDTSARVIALNVSPDMNETDIPPNRLQRAKYKILDMLNLITNGQTGLVVYSSQAFVASPITTDNKNIENLIPVIDNQIVPVQGDSIDNAVLKSSQLLAQSGFNSGAIILVTSSANNIHSNVINEVTKSGYTISILDVAAQPNSQLQQLAQQGNGVYYLFNNTDSDIKKIIAATNNNNNRNAEEILGVSMWQDQGHWLIFAAIILTLFIARRGWLQKLC